MVGRIDAPSLHLRIPSVPPVSQSSPPSDGTFGLPRPHLMLLGWGRASSMGRDACAACAALDAVDLLDLLDGRTGH